MIEPLWSLLPQNGIHDPASSNMGTWASAMVHDVGVRATCIFKRISQEWQAIEDSAIEDVLSQIKHHRIDPDRDQNGGPEWISENVLQNLASDLCQFVFVTTLTLRESLKERQDVRS
jgi:hypothetical protein